jgi:acyl CoA:acetate/3-ketoacid CoA transferase alpha subunit
MLHRHIGQRYMPVCLVRRCTEGQTLAEAALAGLVAVGGFGLCGIPEALIAALRDSGRPG